MLGRGFEWLVDVIRALTGEEKAEAGLLIVIVTLYGLAGLVVWCRECGRND
jgi:hypothetical protein